MKKIIISLISLLTLSFIMMVSFKEVHYKVEAKGEYESSNYSLSKIVNSNNYQDFLDINKNINKPDDEIIVSLEGYEFKNSLFEDDNPYFDFFKDDENVEKHGLYIPETGDVTFFVEVSKKGFYNINIDYFNVLGRGASIDRGIMINGEYQFLEADNISLNRYYEDEFNVGDRSEKGINDLRPKQIERHLWSSTYLEDLMGYYNEPFSFLFEEGINEITFISEREPFVIGEIKLNQAELESNYESYLNNHLNNGVKKVESDFNVTYQAENTLHKTSPTLQPVAEFSSSKYVPYEKYVTKYNAIGGETWRIPGDEIVWEVEVPEEGLYLLTFKVMQNFNRGKNTTRSLKVNGSYPFEEARNIDFKYNSTLRNRTVGNENNYYIFFNKGKNEISLKTTVGVYGEVINNVNVDIKLMRELYREVVMRTSLNPDPLQDYMLESHIENLYERIEELKNNLNNNKKRIIEISNGRSELISPFERTAYQLEKFLKDEKNIQKGLREFEQNISSLGSWVIQISEQPLIIDEIIVHGTEYKLPKTKMGFFGKIWHEIVLFFTSFKDDGAFGSTMKVDGPTIEVWTGTGRDQTTILRQLIDESFVSQYNINVDLKMVNLGVLLSASLSGNGPDVAIGTDEKLPVNWGVRGAITDISKFDDFNEVESWFSKSAMKPLTFEDKVYALPSTEDFLVMFYREDILNEIGVNKIPETWDDVIDISPILQKQYLDFYIPLSQGALSTPLYAMIKQNGGDLYLDGGREIGLLERENIDAFVQFTNFFTDYGFVLQADFLNRFRSGEMPIGITNYTMYNSLAVFSPEIQGNWNYGLIPGTKDSEGKINHATTSTVSSTVILSDTKYENESWEFMKWFHSEETQLSYARGMEAILGAAARYPTANLNAFSQLSWPAKDYILLEEQRSYAEGVPTVPGDYIVGRHIDNAFRLALNENILPQDSLYQYSLTINAEIKRKRLELGLD